MVNSSIIIEAPQKVTRVGNFMAEGNSILVPCSTTSGSSEVAFPALRIGSASTDVMISNRGSVDVWLAFGDSSVAAAIPTAGTPANGQCIAAGAVMVLSKGAAEYVAGVTATSTADVYITPGYGS